MTFHAAVKEALWMRRLMKDLDQGDMCVPMMCDNMGCISNVKNHMSSQYVKHIDVAYHMVRDQVSAGYVNPIICVYW